MPELIYVYCVMDRMPVLEYLTVSARPDLLTHDDLYAVIGRVPPEEFSAESLSKRISDLDWLADRVRLHERVIEHAMQYGAVMPFKFGTVFNNEENVSRMLAAHGMEFRRQLAELANKDEWGVKVYCDCDRLAHTVVESNPVLVSLDREIAAAPKGRGFLLSRRRGELVASAVKNESVRLGQECYDRLARQGLRARANEPLPREATGHTEAMILNGAFLVARDRTQEFAGTVTGLQEQFADHGLRIERSGPWPPYNFCEFRMEPARVG